MVVVLSFLFGLSVGSFLNVVILRSHRGEKISGRSYCESCKTTLSVKELIPVFSFLIQKGRCRTCGAALSWQYPLVELGSALLFAAAMWYFLPQLSLDIQSFLFLFALSVGLGAAIVIFVSDLRFEIIPNGAVLTLLILGFIAVLYRTKSGTGDVVWDFAASLIFSLFLASLWFFSQGRWMGFGDVKLIFATSLLLGFPASIVAFLYSFWIGGIIGVILLCSGLRTLKHHIPFGPFIVIGSLLAYFTADSFLALAGLKGLFNL